MKQYIPKIVRPILSIILISIISLVLGELTLRIYHLFNPLFIFYDNSYDRFRGKPFADDWDFKLNSQGFKDIEFSLSKQQGYRILGIGDSFAYGVVPYKYNYLTLLESQFQQESVKVEVLNMGIPSIGPNEYLSVLMREGLEFHPDMVLLSFFIGNDFVQSGSPRKWYSYSYVASLFHYLLTIRPKYEGRIVHGKGVYCDECPVFDQVTHLKIEKDRSSIYVTDNTDFIPLLEKTVDLLNQIQTVCSNKGIELVVVIIPDEVQINSWLQMEVRTQLMIQEKAWNITLPNERLTAELKNKGIDYLDLYPYFVKEAQVRQLYRPRDTHWNIAGNQLAANIIQSHIHHYVKPMKRASAPGNVALKKGEANLPKKSVVNSMH